VVRWRKNVKVGGRESGAYRCCFRIAPILLLQMRLGCFGRLADCGFAVQEVARRKWESLEIGGHMMPSMAVMGCRVVGILAERRGSSIDRGTEVHMYYPLSLFSRSRIADEGSYSLASG
jgi:hypothetical protein